MSPNNSEVTNNAPSPITDKQSITPGGRKRETTRPQVELSSSPNLNEFPDSPNLPDQRSAGIRSDTQPEMAALSVKLT